MTEKKAGFIIQSGKKDFSKPERELSEEQRWRGSKKALLIKGTQISILQEDTSPVSLDWKHLAFKTEGTLSLDNLFKTGSLQMILSSRSVKG